MTRVPVMRLAAGVGLALVALFAGLAVVHRYYGLSGELLGLTLTLAGVTIGGLGTVVKAVADRIVADLKADIAENTAKTEAAQAAATKAEATSNGRLTEQIRLNQELQQKLYYNQRLLDALSMDPEGVKALARARELLDSLRLMRPGANPAPRITPE